MRFMIVVKATGDLFEPHGAALYRFARVLLHQPQDAEDVVQTTFVRLMEHLARGGERSNLKGWLFTVAANLSRDRLRGRRRWLPWDAARAPRVSADTAFEAAAPQQACLDATRRLRPRDRLRLALRAEGCSYREMAEAAGVRQSSVGHLLARAIARWKSGVSGQGPGVR